LARGARGAVSVVDWRGSSVCLFSLVGKFWNDLPFADGAGSITFPFPSGLAAAPIDASGLADSFSKVAKRPVSHASKGRSAEASHASGVIDRVSFILGGWNLVALLQLA